MCPMVRMLAVLVDRYALAKPIMEKVWKINELMLYLCHVVQIVCGLVACQSAVMML